MTTPYYDPRTEEVEDLTPTERARREAEAPYSTRLTEAEPYEVERAASGARFGGAGQVALGLAEKALPPLRAFADDNEALGRAQHLEREYPIAAGAASAVPQLALSMLGGPAAVAARAAGMGAAGARVAGSAAVGMLGGAATEAERAYVSETDFSVGNMLMFGIGGELLGGAVSAGARAAGRGATRLAKNVLARAERRAAAESLEAAIESRAPAALRAHADAVLKRAGKDLDTALGDLGEQAKAARFSPDLDAVPDAPVSFTAEQLQPFVDSGVELGGRAHVAVDKLLSAKTLRAAYSALDDLDALLPEGPGRAALRDSLLQEALWGQREVTARKAFYGAQARALSDAPHERLAAYADLGLDVNKANAAVALRDATTAATRAGPDVGDTISDALNDAAATVIPGAIGALLGGPVGAAAGAALRYTGALTGITKGASVATQRAARALVAASERPSTVRAAQGYARVAGQAATAAGRAGAGVASAASVPAEPNALQRFTSGYATPAQAYAARRDAVRLAARDPRAFAETVARSFGDLPDREPVIYGAIAGRLGTMLAHLYTTLPAGVVRTLKQPQGLPPSASDISKYAAIWEAATDPSSVLRDLHNGKLRPEALQTLKAVHPDIFESLRYAVVREIAYASGPIPTQTKLRLDLLFELDGAATPAFSRAMGATIRGAAERQAQGRRGQLDGPDLGARATVAISAGPTSVGGAR